MFEYILLFLIWLAGMFGAHTAAILKSLPLFILSNIVIFFAAFNIGYRLVKYFVDWLKR